jgi:superfamily II DNA helicase RecQ
MALLNERDVVCTVATGKGKSLAFEAPMLIRNDGMAWVISPLNALMSTQVCFPIEPYKTCLTLRRLPNSTA